MDHNKFEEVLDININLNSNNSLKCLIACKTRSKKQILLFDFNQDKQYNNATDSVETNENRERIVSGKDDRVYVINFKSEPSSNMMVRISKNND